MPDVAPAPSSPPADPTAAAKARKRRRRRIRYGVYLVLYVLVMLFARPADRLILYPSTEAIRPPDGTARVLIPVAGREPVEALSLRANCRGDQQPEAFVIVFNGNADRAEYAVEYGRGEAGRRPVEVWAMNYPGYGGSPGTATLGGIAPAALATFDHVKAIAGDRPIIVSGNSLGTTAALHVAARRPVAGLILYNPPPLRRMILQRHGWWNLWLLAGPVALGVPSDLDSLANAAASKCPAVFVLAGKDEVVPPKYQRMVADAYGGPKREVTLADAGHNTTAGGDAADQIDAAMEWMWEAAGR